MKVLVSDVGYGDTKYVVVDGESRQGKIPTLVAPIMDSEGFGESGTLTFGGRSYLVGSDARYANYVIPTTTEDFLTTYSPPDSREDHVLGGPGRCGSDDSELEPQRLGQGGEV